MQKERWAAVVDTVGSTTLANALAQCKYGASIAACGLAGGMDLPTTVAPFILRNVRLLGVDSVMAPLARRQQAWDRLARDLDASKLESMIDAVPLEGAIAKAHDLMAVARGLDEAAVDLLLADAGLAAALADEDALGIAARTVENFLRDEFVVEDDVGVLERLQRAKRQKIGIAWTGANKMHHASLLFRRLCRFDGGLQPVLRLAPAAGERSRPDRAVDHALPEPPKRPRRVALAREVRAIAGQQRGKIVASFALGTRRLYAVAVLRCAAETLRLNAQAAVRTGSMSPASRVLTVRPPYSHQTSPVSRCLCSKT